ncbi:MAG: CbiX/SirB N-terminal domain-containing protein [Planctomycetaceae bacterium]|jgi:cobalamin biosynthesis Co2+ chelatase CbiK|nr:CbiX/SirB N-terminal domain-containing protein [Planctomycetaceae bacterium]
MTRHSQVLFSAVFMLLSAAATSEAAETQAKRDKPGLLILTHGSSAPAWNKAVETLAGKVRTLNETKKTFHAVAFANLEFAQPGVAETIEKMEGWGCSRIIVVPAFVTSSSHSHFDVPAALGIYSSPSTRQHVHSHASHGHGHEHDKHGEHEHCITQATPHVPVTVTQTFNEGDLLDRYIQEETAKLSEKPEDEALLIISHGDDTHSGLVEPVMRRLLVSGAGSRKITAGDYVYCGMGQTYAQNVVPAIRRLAEKRKRILVVGLYFVASAKTIEKRTWIDGKPPERSPLSGVEVRFSETGLIDCPATPQWILNTAAEALNIPQAAKAE